MTWLEIQDLEARVAELEDLQWSAMDLVGEARVEVDYHFHSPSLS